MLVLVTVPIGNYKDITLNAIEKLNSCSFILAEDTRVTKQMLKEVGVDYSEKNIYSFHDHNSQTKLESVLELIQENEVALVSDAGSPSISDPAFPLVLACLDRELEVQAASGICAPIAALERSGLMPIPFQFHGFPPRDKGKRAKVYEQVSQVYGTHIFFEGVSRVKESVDQLVKMIPDGKFCIGREITKSFDSFYRFDKEQWETLKEEIVYKGEFVVLVECNNVQVSSSKELIQLAEDILNKGAKPKLLSKLLSTITGKKSKDIYQELIK